MSHDAHNKSSIAKFVGIILGYEKNFENRLSALNEIEKKLNEDANNSIKQPILNPLKDTIRELSGSVSPRDNLRVGKNLIQTANFLKDKVDRISEEKNLTPNIKNEIYQDALSFLFLQTVNLPNNSLIGVNTEWNFEDIMSKPEFLTPLNQDQKTKILAEVLMKRKEVKSSQDLKDTLSGVSNEEGLLKASSQLFQKLRNTRLPEEEKDMQYNNIMEVKIREMMSEKKIENFDAFIEKLNQPGMNPLDPALVMRLKNRYEL